MRRKNNNMPVGMAERIKECVLEDGDSIVQVAKRLEISRSLLYSYMNGDSVPNGIIIARMCKLFGVRADWLLFGE